MSVIGLQKVLCKRYEKAEPEPGIVFGGGIDVDRGIFQDGRHQVHLTDVIWMLSLKQLGQTGKKGETSFCSNIDVIFGYK